MGVKPWDGFQVRRPKRGLSHHVMKLGQRLLTWPHRRVVIGEHYAKEAGAYLEEALALEDIRARPEPILSEVEGHSRTDNPTSHEEPGRHRDEEERESGKNPDSRIKDG